MRPRIVNVKFWNSRAPEGYLSNRRWKSEARRFCRKLLASEFSIKPNLTLLEVGFGGCNERIALGNAIPSEANYIGVDVCERFAEHARKKFPNDKWIVADITKDDPMNADIVYSQHVLEHCPTLSPALDWMLRSSRAMVVNIFFRPPGELEVLGMSRRICTNIYSIGDIQRVCAAHGFTSEFIEFENRRGRDKRETVLIAKRYENAS